MKERNKCEYYFCIHIDILIIIRQVQDPTEKEIREENVSSQAYKFRYHVLTETICIW